MKPTIRMFVRLAMAVGAAFACTVIATAQIQYTLPAVDHGAYDETGYHHPNAPEYVTGLRGHQFRSFFVFDGTLLPASFERAELRLFLPPGGYDSPHANENFVIYKVNSTPISRLVGGGVGLTTVFSDLGGGTNFGSCRIGKADQGQYVTVPLNETFEAFLESVTGLFGIGARLSTLSGSAAQNLFGVAEGSTLPADSVLLVVYGPEGQVNSHPMAAVPEAGTYPVIAGGLLLAVVALRTFRRRRA